MGQSVKDNQHKILRFLYHNRGKFKSRREIEDGTGLSEAQVRYALKNIDEYVKRKESDTRGDIQNAYVYSINSDGRAYVRNHIDEIPVEQQNSEKLDKHDKEIMRLRSAISDVEDDLTGWIEYRSEWSSAAKKRFEAIEKRLENIEDELMDED